MNNSEFKINYYFNLLKEFPIYPRYKFMEYLGRFKLDSNTRNSIAEKIYRYQKNKYGKGVSFYDSKRKL